MTHASDCGARKDYRKSVGFQYMRSARGRVLIDRRGDTTVVLFLRSGLVSAVGLVMRRIAGKRRPHASRRKHQLAHRASESRFERPSDFNLPIGWLSHAA